jgi:hypothetical protein
VQNNSTIGGSSYAVSGAHSIIGLPGALVTVVYRPWPWEAGNLQGFIASIEGVFLLALSFYLLSQRSKAILAFRRSPYTKFACIYVCLFCFAFSSIGNFGIIVRERVQVMPLFLLILSLAFMDDRPQRPPPKNAAVPLRLSHPVWKQ